MCKREAPILQNPHCEWTAPALVDSSLAKDSEPLIHYAVSRFLLGGDWAL